TPDDEMRLKPIVALALIEEDLEEAEADAEECDADVIDFEALAGLFTGDVGRIDDQGGSEKDGKKSDGNVDEENPAPGVVVREPAAESWPDDWGDDNAHAIDGHGHALFFARKTFDKDGLRDGLQAAAARSLNYSKEDEQRQAGSNAAQK